MTIPTILLLDYSVWCHLAPNSWIKSFWEALSVYPGNLLLKYESILLQRTHDRSLMDVAFSAGLRGQDLVSFNRCRCKRKLLLLSDLSTASGDRIEAWVLQNNFSLSSRLDFPPEYPTVHDRRVWSQFWTAMKHNSTPLGEWLTAPHFRWPWHLSESGILYGISQDGWLVHEHLSPRTCLNSGYAPTSTIDTFPPSLPVSITQTYCAGRSIITNPLPGPPLVELSQTMQTVWDLLHSWGGDWMWTSIFFPGNCRDISWLISGISAGTVIGCADGSFDSKKSSRLCSAGWILYDTSANTHLAGSFCEFSPGAGSYCGEVLGLCAIHLLLLAFQEWFHLDVLPPLAIYCDNEKAGERAQANNRRIKPGWSCADVLRSLRDTRSVLKSTPTVHHVSAHMDDLIPWHQLSLPERLNCMCDALAKDALQQGIQNKYTDKNNILPRELSAVYFADGKAMSDPAVHIRLALGKLQAKQFLVEERNWSIVKFNEVAWDALHDTLSSKPVAFRLWLSKQHSDFCASGVQMKR